MSELVARIHLATPEATAALACWLADRSRPGDTILLTGNVGAGKTHFARCFIQHILARDDLLEDVPSPTFTIVQTYETLEYEIWHADLYRLHSPNDTVELGLDAAFRTAICLVEWPDRLGSLIPQNALSITLSVGETDDSRDAMLECTTPRWSALLRSLTQMSRNGFPPSA
jgi:tRNA threonylcarbamoyladenosine biosynthesis protein TsaE